MDMGASLSLRLGEEDLGRMIECFVFVYCTYIPAVVQSAVFVP